MDSTQRDSANPPYDNVNMSMSSMAQYYAIVPNPDLRPERSSSVETGIRGEGKTWDVSFSLYQNSYHDFIDATVLSVDQTGFMTFQYQNIQKVRIEGWEAKAGCAFWEGFPFPVCPGLCQGGR